MRATQHVQEERLIRLLLGRPAAWEEFQRVGLSRTWLSKESREALDKIELYHRRHGAVPTAAWLRSVVPGLELQIKPSKIHTVSGLCAEISGSHLDTKVGGILSEWEDEHAEYRANPRKYYELVESIREAVDDHTQDQAKAFSFADLNTALVERYVRLASGDITGTPIPFPFLRDNFKMWVPGEITGVIAPTGVGKTWFLVWSAIASIAAKRRALFVSLEMTPEEILERVAACMAGVYYGDIVAGTLSPDDLKTYKTFLDNATPDSVPNQLKVVGPDEVSTPDDIHAYAERLEVDDVFVDSFYLLEGPGDELWKTVQFNMKRMRYHTLSRKRPRMWMYTSQLNDDARGTQTATASAVAYSKAIGRDSNNLVFLIQREKDRRTGRMIIKVGKARSKRTGVAYEYFLDPATLKFKETGEYQPKTVKREGMPL